MTILDYLDHEVDDKHTDKGQAMRLAEHEFMLSFNNDVGAYAFSDWWATKGRSLYENYVADNLDKINEMYR